MGNLLEGKVAVVTGGASGIGRAISLRFAGEGAHVVVADKQREPREGEGNTDELVSAQGVEGRFATCDVTDVASLEGPMAVADELGGIDILVAAAGIFRRHDVLDVTEAEFQQMFDINVAGVFFSAQAAARRMVAKGSGSIITLASTAASRGSSGAVVYCASKGAVRLMTYALAAELGPRGVRVNAIHPGLTATTMTKVDVPVVGTEREAQAVAQTALGRYGEPDDVAGVAVFLASDLGRYVSGTSVVVDGGTFRG